MINSKCVLHRSCLLWWQAEERLVTLVRLFLMCIFIHNFICRYLFLQLKMNVQQHIMPQLQDLYHFLERDFSPLKLCARVNVFFEFLLNNEELAFRLCEAFAGGVHCTSVKTGQPLNSEVIIPYRVSVLFHNSM